MVLSFLNSETADLQMPDWALYNSKWNWRSFLEDVFSELDARNPQNLIIDLRGNEGGLDAGNPILAHLADHDLQLRSYERRVRYRKVPDSLSPIWTLGTQPSRIGGKRQSICITGSFASLVMMTRKAET